MAYFTKEYIDFFQELEKNNSKEWFDQNRKRYENFVRKPMVRLVEDVIEAMQAYDDSFNPDPKKCIGRINRDIRFSKDKTPYNLHFFANITKGSKENPMAGIAFRFGGHDCGIMAGFYQMSKERLAHARQKIKGNLKEFQKLKSDNEFVKKFGEIQGEAYKRVPPELKSTFEIEPLIANKQFFYVAEKEGEFILSDQLKETIVDYWLAAKSMNDFLNNV
jgi:uncharacterized protein (TIGR02453 family)